ncbi:MAG TPA: prohibitin family protein [Anaerolineales bacterium]|nr:prohibitin family protein [Anaerolineales bacterium]
MGIQSILAIVSSVAWIGVIVAVGYLVVSVARGQKLGNSISLIVGGIVLAAVLSTAAAGTVFVETQQRGVVITAVGSGGIRPEPLASGLHWVIPVAEQVRIYDVSRQTYTMSSVNDEGQSGGDDSIEARTRDGQQVRIDASVIYQPDPSRIVALHQTWQDRYEDQVVRPLARGILRDIASQYGVEEIVSSKRAELEQKITEEFERKLAEQNLILIDFVLRNISFSEAYAQAVEQKQIAEQQAQQAQFVVEQRKQEAEQARQVAQGQADAAVIAAEADAKARVIQAQAEAEAMRAISAALAENPQLLTYQYIQKLAPGVQTIYLPSNQTFLLPLPGADGATTTEPVVAPTPEPTPEPTPTPTP